MNPASVLPEDWRAAHLGEIARIERGKFSHRPRNDPRFYGGLTPFVQTGDVTKANGRIREYSQTLNELGLSVSKTFRPGVILITIAANIGYSGILEFESACPDSLIGITPVDEVDAEFLQFYLSTQQPEMDRLAPRGTQKNINIEFLRPWPVIVPPLPEQQKIAAVLGEVQRAMEQQERLLALTAELKKTLLHQLFTQGLRHEPQKQTDIGPVPESWEVVKLADVCTFQSGGTPSKQRPDYWEGTIPWVSPKDMKRPRLSDVTDHISQEALEEGSKLAPAGSIFVVVRGMILAKDVPVALAEVPMAINQDMRAIIPSQRVEPAFLLYAMVALKQKLFEKVGRSAHGTMTLMSSEIAAFEIPLPDKETQIEISNAIELVEQKHAHVRCKHTTLTALFRTLLHELMTAKTRVHELEINA